MKVHIPNNLIHTLWGLFTQFSI